MTLIATIEIEFSTAKPKLTVGEMQTLLGEWFSFCPAPEDCRFGRAQLVAVRVTPEETEKTL